MTDTPDPADMAVLAADQRRAAELAEACVHGDGDEVGRLLAELLDVEAERALAVTAVLARNLAIVLVRWLGRADALALLESTRLDAAVADD
jgi:hypothetical protein